MVLTQLVDSCAVGFLVQCIPWDALQGHLRDNSQGPHTHTNPSKQVGVWSICRKLECAAPWCHDSHLRDHLIDSRNARSSAMGAGLRPAGYLLLGDRAEVR